MSTSLPKRRAGARNGARLAEQAIDAELARQRADADAAARTVTARREAARAAERARPKFTRTDLQDAVLIHDGSAWRRVVTVNTTTVSVATAYSWTDKVPLANIHALARADKQIIKPQETDDA